MQSAYEVHRSEGRLPATYEVVFGQAWAPARRRARARSAAGISLEALSEQARRAAPAHDVLAINPDGRSRGSLASARVT